MGDYHSIAKEFAEGRASYQQQQRAGIEHGSQVSLPTLQRYVILDTIFDPTIIDDVKLDYWEHELGISNIKYAVRPPRNAVIAQRVKGHSSSPTEAPMVLYPFFPPNLSLPCKPGEHVWVVFEDQEGTKNDLGYWMCRIVGPGFVEDVNHTHAPRAHDASFTPGTKDKFDGNAAAKYEFRNGKVGEVDGERYTVAASSTVHGDEDAYKQLMKDSDGGRLCSYEPVPRYRKRPSELVLEGTNNAAVIVGTDRVGPVAEYDRDESRGAQPVVPTSDLQGLNTGKVDIVAGRGQTPVTGGTTVENDLPGSEIGKSDQELAVAEGDVDYANDRSRVLVAQRTRVDANFALEAFNVEFDGGKYPGTASVVKNVKDSEDGDGCVVVKSDKVRIIARSDIEFLVTTYTRDAEGKMVVVEDRSKWAAIVLKSTGDIIFRAAANGYVKLGSEAASHPIVCADFAAIAKDGRVESSPPIITTMGGQFVTGIKGQGMYSSKVLAE